MTHWLLMPIFRQLEFDTRFVRLDADLSVRLNTMLIPLSTLQNASGNYPLVSRKLLAMMWHGQRLP